MSEEYQKPGCERCGRKGNVLFRVDGSYMCRNCGYDSRKAKKIGIKTE